MASRTSFHRIYQDTPVSVQEHGRLRQTGIVVVNDELQVGAALARLPTREVWPAALFLCLVLFEAVRSAPTRRLQSTSLVCTPSGCLLHPALRSTMT
jgi:hypothetical protein